MRDMTFEQFQKLTINAFKEEFPNSEVSIRTVMKNNGVELVGLCVHDDDTKVYPTIYLRQYYDAYIHQTLDTIWDKMIYDYRKAMVTPFGNLDDLMDFNTCSNFIYARIINIEENETKLQDLIYREFLDLAIVPYIRLQEKNTATFGTINITHEIFKKWDPSITEDELITLALINTESTFPPEICSITDMLRQIDPGLFRDNDMISFPDDIMYVMKCSDQLGAIAMVFNDELQQFAEEKGCNLWILPSSIHEVILVPATDNNIPPTELSDMVRTVNDTELDYVDILSNHAYLYNFKERTYIKF